MSRLFEVALVIDPTKPYDRRIVRGVAACVQREGLDWSLYVEEDPVHCLPDMKNWEGDGILANFDNQRVANAAMKANVAVVGIGGGYGYYKPESRIPYVRTDNKAISALAFDHLVNLGLTNFAFCGEVSSRLNGWSKERGDAFQALVVEAGLRCEVFTGRYKAATHWKQSQNELTRWLGSLSLPIGLMACNDSRARQVLQACKKAEIRVPEDIAIVGVDNDEIMCELARPPLTSIEQGAKRIGSEAALILDSLMRGKKAMTHTAVPPEGLVERLSTDVLNLDDVDVAAALRFIRKHACDPIQVKDVLQEVNLSRSTLEARFRELLNRSVHSEIRRIQLERAKSLLKSSKMPIKEIVKEVGASSVQYFTAMMRTGTGQTPGKIREEAQS